MKNSRETRPQGQGDESICCDIDFAGVLCALCVLMNSDCINEFQLPTWICLQGMMLNISKCYPSIENVCAVKSITFFRERVVVMDTSSEIVDSYGAGYPDKRRKEMQNSRSCEKILGVLVGNCSL